MRAQSASVVKVLLVTTWLSIFSPAVFSSTGLDCTQAYASPSVLWPPNHKVHHIEVLGVSGADTLQVQCIAQDEPLNTQGDGNTEYDGEGIGTNRARLRAERTGGGNGRVYHIDFLASSAGGAQCNGTVQVSVPHDKKTPATDDGRLYLSAPDGINCNGQPNNLPPVISSTPLEQATVDTPYQYNVDATDPDNDPIVYSLTQAPAGMVIDSVSGLVQWTPVSAQLGAHTVSLTAADDQGGSSVQSFTVTVLQPVNHDPVITSTPGLEAPVGFLYTYAVIASDVDGDSLSYQLDVAPAGMTIDTAGLVQWTPATAQVGDHSVSLSVSDGKGGTASQSYTLTVPVGNSAPLITSVPPPQAVLNQVYSYAVIASDVDGDTLGYSLLVAPAGMAIDPATGLIQWTPVAGQEGDHAVSLLVDDANGGTATQDYTVSVIIPNNNPAILSAPVLNAMADRGYSYAVIADDPDGDSLSYALATAPAAMTIDAAGLISWLPTTADVGVHSVNVVVSDGRGGSASQTFDVTVASFVNQPPTIISVPVWSARATDPFHYQVMATDPDQDPITYALVQGPAAMTLDPVSGDLLWTPQLSDVGNHTVILSATDSFGAADGQQFTLSVLAQTNRAPQINSAPVTTVQEADLIQGGSYSYPVTATDPDGDSLTYILSQAPEGMQIDAGTGAINWVPTIPAQLGSHPVTVTVLDAFGAYATQNYVVDVIGVMNQPPVISSVAVTQAVLNALYSYPVVATDGNNDPLSWSLTQAPAGMQIDPVSGLISWVPDTQTAGVPVTVRVDDGRGAFDEQSFSVAVSQGSNSPPTIISSPPRTANDGEVYHYPLVAVDPDPNDTLTYANLGFNNNINFDTQTGDFLWNGSPQLPVYSKASNDLCSLPVSNNEPLFNASGWTVFRDVGVHSGVQNWSFIDGGTTAVATGNGDPSVLMSDIELTDGVIEMHMTVYGGDNDQFGFVWGFQDMQRYYRFMWDQGNNVRGFLVTKIDSPAPRFAGGDPTDVHLYQQKDIPWQWQTEYRIVLDVKPGQAIIYVLEGNKLLQVIPIRDDLYTSGRFGFLVSSQDNVHYRARYISRNTAADLIIDSMDVSTDGVNDTYTVSVLNRGGSATTASTTVDLVAAEYDSTAGSRNPLALGSLALPPLAAGATQQLTLTRPAQGSFYALLEAHIDPTGADILECNQDNNLARSPIVRLRATDSSGNSDTQIYNINMLDVNEAPQFTTTPPQFAALGDAYEYNVIATDGDLGDAVRYELVDGPAGMNFYLGSAMLVWTPTATELGQTFPVSIRAVDLQGAETLQNYTVTLQEKPTITTTPEIIARAGQAYVYDVDATDPENDTLTYSLEKAPAGMTIDAASGVISWSPATAGEFHEVEVKVDDGRAGIARQLYTLAVLLPGEVNTPPVVTSTPVLTATPLTDYTYNVNATDPDGDLVIYTLREAPAAMRIDLSNGIINWRPAVTQTSNIPVRVEVNDRRGGITEQAFTISSGGGIGNGAPVISSSPAQTVQADTQYVYQVIASDPELETLTYTLESKPAGMTISSVGEVRWLPTPADLGDHSVVVRVSDTAGNFAQQSFSLTVQDNNNTAPVISSQPATVTLVDQPYNYNVQASDPDGDTLSYSLVNAPAGMTLSPTGVIDWTPTQANAGDHLIVIAVSDDRGAQATQSYTLQVQVNGTPVINSAPPLTATVGVPYQYLASAFDSNGDSLLYSLDDAPAGMAVDANTGVVSWTPAADQAGQQAVTLRVTDSNGFSSIQSYSINVTLVVGNQAPQVNGSLPAGAQVDVSYQAVVPVTDPDGDTLNYTLVSGPAGMILDGVTGVLNWTPAASQIGAQAVSINVDDGALGVTLNTVITVDASALPLDLSLSITPATVQPDGTVQLTLNPQGGQGSLTLAADLDGTPLSLTNGQTQISKSLSGRYDISASVTDSATGEVVTAGGFFTVVDSSDSIAPTVSLESPTTGTLVTAPVDIVATIQDANLAGYKVLLQRKGTNTQTLIAQGSTPVSSAVVGSLDPSLLVNGQYDLILVATDTSGQGSTSSASVQIDGDLKVGNFSFSVVDLEIPLAGIPIQITRTYDSRRRDEHLDFGHGWSVDYQNVRVEESRDPGLYWALNTYGFGPLNLLTRYCVEPLGAPVVTVTLGDGQQEVFEVNANPRCNDNTPFLDVTLDFVPVGNTLSTLEVIGDDTARLVNGHLVETGAFTTPVNPNRYRLTTREGFVYSLDQDFGVTQIATPNGHTLSYTDNGIIHSGGKSVTFSRDSQGKITAITDPMGNSLNYIYSSIDDLVRATDQTAATTQYTYNNRHGLLDIIDPLGRRLMKNIYDTSGRLIAQEDSDGNRTDFNHDIGARTSVVTDRLGNPTQFGYDDRGNVVAQIDALGGTTAFTYDADDNQLSETNPLGFTSHATYDNRRNQLTQTDPLGNTVQFTYNARGQETTVTDARGNGFTNVYDSVGNLLTVQDPDGNVASNNIDINGNISSTTDMLGNTTSFTYDSDGNKLSETDSEGNTTTFTYDPNGNVLTESRQQTINGQLVTQTTSFTYDASNRLVSTTNTQGNTTLTEYDLAGNEIALVDALGRRTQMDYDVYGRLTQVTYHDGTTESKSYDAEGNLVTETDRLGRTTTFVYDALNRLVQTLYADGSGVSTDYDLAGRVIAEIDANGNRTEYQYDAAGRRILSRDALGNEHQFSYDAEGNLASETDANGHIISYSYNALDQRTQTTFHDGTVMLDLWDAMGRKTAHTDQAGVSTHFAYDTLGRLTGVTDVQGNTTAFTYDEVGNKLTQTDANGHVTRWAYDILGQQTQRILPIGQSEVFTYDANGNLKTSTDFNGSVTTHSYDSNDRLVQVVYADGSQEGIQYDAVGNRTQAIQTDASGSGRTKAWIYDNRDRLSTETQADGSSLAYSYDSAGNRTGVTLTPAGGAQTPVITSFGYDVLNRLASVTDANGTTNYGYDSTGNRISVSYPNGASQTYSYDALNRLTNLAHYDSVGTLTQRYDYTLNATGRRTGIVELNGRSTQYSYDNLYRLVGETITDPVNGNYQASYQYGSVGNRTFSTIDGISTAYSYDANDRLTQQGGSTYTYDANGNTLTETLDGQTTQYTYDLKNQLVTVDKSGTTTSYAYDVDGIRTDKTEAGVTSRYTVDGNREHAQVLLEGNPSRTIAYTYGDDLIAQDNGGSVSYYHYDGLGSTRTLTDAAAAVTDTYNYDAFGIELNSTGTTENHYRFTGEQFDSSLSQYYLRARYYDPSVGRFTQMDTWMGTNSDPITLHKYLYANADPGNVIDPSGNFGLVSLGVANNIRGILTETQINVGLSLLDVALGGESAGGSNMLLGLAAMGGPAAFKLLSKFSSKFRKACNSFDGDTLVHTEQGLKPITDIRIGDKVWAFDEQTGEKTLQEVVHLISGEGDKQLVDIVLDSGEVISTTAGHPFYDPDRKVWVNAMDLSSVNSLLGLRGDVLSIEDIRVYTEPAKVYNLTVANDHTYYVGERGVLSHNAGPCRVPIFDTRTTNHIRGEFNAAGKFVGYHSRFGGADRADVRVINIVRPKGGNKNKIYRGQVQVLKNGVWVNKKGNISTFWPDGWDLRRIQQEVNAAYIKAVGAGFKGNGRAQVKGPSGFEVLIQAENGVIIRTHPVF